MRRTEVTFRQIHLDFHTSELIPGVGSLFDPKEFGDTLRRAHVDSILCFARCHHGWLYYDAGLNPERKHPSLSRNLLRDQIEACHAVGIRAPIYTTVQWDSLTCELHPEWRIVKADGCLEGTPPYEAGFYRKLCLNSPYREWFKAHTLDILDSLPIDGIYFDFIRPDDCSCSHCRAKMSAEGLDPSVESARISFGLETVNEFEREIAALVRTRDQECSITFNGGHIGLRHRGLADSYTHFELETLPSGGWGYMYFPATVRYARTLGPEIMGTTGRFHTSWGDFHSLKNLPALQFEVFRMLAHGAKCSIGDQMHPSGRLEPAAYELIARVYAEVEEKEPWCRNVLPVVEIGVFHPEEFLGASAQHLPTAIQGVVRMLEEGGHQFDVIDSASPLDKYAVLVLPDYIAVDRVFGEKLSRYVASGGALIASYASGLDASGRGFTLGCLGVGLANEGPRDDSGELARGRSYERNDFCEYLAARPKINAGLPSAEMPMYIHGMEIVAAPSATVLADKVLPYFDRSFRHFMSHRQAPSTGVVAGPAIVQDRSCVYFANPIFSQYELNAPAWCKTLFLNALALLLPDPLVRHNGPSTVQVTINEQPAFNRWTAHALHYIPERRSAQFDTITDVIPLRDLAMSFRVPRRVLSVSMVPANVKLDFTLEGGRLDVVVPEIVGHQMLSIEFE